jgi:DNA processing protein
VVVLSAAGHDCSVLQDPIGKARAIVGDDVEAVAHCLVDPWQARGGEIVWWDDPATPAGLRDLGSAAPLMLWVRGALSAESSVAVVGSRRCTDYGARMTAGLAAALMGTGKVVVSGGAVGIDAAAHAGALDAGGSTMVFLAGGAGRVYPPTNEALFVRAAAQGALVWEFPPSVALRKQSFLIRNRLIAATASATVLVEAAERSGALNTGRTAADLGRLVLAVPGRIDSLVSAGTNRAIADGWAAILLGPTDLAELLSCT